VLGGWTDLSTIAKSEATEACVTIPLPHRIFYFKMSHPFFKELYFGAFFSLGSNGRVRGL
jgi:hypothetical protein